MQSECVEEVAYPCLEHPKRDLALTKGSLQVDYA